MMRTKSPLAPAGHHSVPTSGPRRAQGACFAAGTLIATPTGLVPIEQVRVGDSVWAFETESERLIARAVTKIVQHDAQPVGELRLTEGGLLRVTAHHPFYLPELGSYAPVGELVVPSVLLELHGDTAAPTAELERFVVGDDAPLITVYDIAVAEQRNYFADGILVQAAPDA